MERIEREKRLALRAAQRDSEAFAALYDAYVDKIYKYVFYKVGGQAEAEDLTAQVFLRAWEAIGEYEWREYPFSAWLFRIAHNLIVDHHRARRETV
jgi:RNA polymerase sigma-70 factor (ECF subfamily)